MNIVWYRYAEAQSWCTEIMSEAHGPSGFDFSLIEEIAQETVVKLHEEPDCKVWSKGLDAYLGTESRLADGKC